MFYFYISVLDFSFVCVGCWVVGYSLCPGVGLANFRFVLSSSCVCIYNMKNVRCWSVRKVLDMWDVYRMSKGVCMW